MDIVLPKITIKSLWLIEKDGSLLPLATAYPPDENGDTRIAITGTERYTMFRQISVGDTTMYRKTIASPIHGLEPKEAISIEDLEKYCADNKINAEAVLGKINTGGVESGRIQTAAAPKAVEPKKSAPKYKTVPPEAPKAIQSVKTTSELVEDLPVDDFDAIMADIENMGV